MTPMTIGSHKRLVAVALCLSMLTVAGCGKSGTPKKTGPTVAQQISTLQGQVHDLNDQLQTTQQRLAASDKWQQQTNGALKGINDHLTPLVEGNAKTQGLNERVDGISQELTQLEESTRAQFKSVESAQKKLNATAEANRVARFKAAARVNSARKVRHVVRKAPDPRPPFAINGIEQRGGQQYLSIAPQGSSSLDDIVLLGVGDTRSMWRLTSIGDGGAVFNVNGRSVTLPVR